MYPPTHPLSITHSQTGVAEYHYRHSRWQGELWGGSALPTPITPRMTSRANHRSRTWICFRSHSRTPRYPNWLHCDGRIDKCATNNALVKFQKNNKSKLKGNLVYIRIQMLFETYIWVKLFLGYIYDFETPKLMHIWFSCGIRFIQLIRSVHEI